MSLTSDEIAYVATRANWFFDVLYPQNLEGGDWTVFTGDGLSDLNRFIGRYQTTPNMRVMVDTGTTTSAYKVATIADIEGIRTVFVATYGSVNVVSPFPPGQEYPTVFQIGTVAIQDPIQPTVEVS